MSNKRKNWMSLVRKARKEISGEKEVVTIFGRKRYWIKKGIE